VEPKLQRRVQQYGWDRAAEFYEQFWHQQLGPATELLLRTADVRIGEHVLDVACGAGAATFPAARAVGPAGRVLGTDISAKMIARSTERAALDQLDHVEFVRADAEDLHTDDSSFDVALCALGLMYVPSPVVALQEMHRSLRSSGRVVVSVWGERRACGWAEIFPIIDARVSSDVCPMFFALGTPGALEAALTHAGFRQVDTTRISVELDYRDDDEALGAAFLGGPVALPYGRLSDAEKVEVHGEYLDSISQYRTADGYRVPGQFVVAAASV
jgi:ubiquinone/menaquinone biosynthesis C-methylase UbiE